jgi:uncharacterized protein (TIGR02145 family)
MIGNNIGKYNIIRLIGEGGMASVYEAEHEMLGTKVAVKVLNPLLSGNAQIKERFRNEAKLMASLDHANITKVLDFDEQPQQLSIVMEYLNGEDLNEKIKRNGALTEKEVVTLFQQILAAFQYAHEKGIVHRDIKPSNIFILPDGRVKILDFGIAKLFGQGNEMTQTGTQMGTPIYMSPEQVKADKSIDHRSDIYSLGVTMFFAINGKPPYNLDTDSQFDIFNKIVYEPIPELNILGVFNKLITKACNKNREERFQSCAEWINELEAVNQPHVSSNEIKTKNNSLNSTQSIQDKTHVSADGVIQKKKRKRIIIAVIILVLITLTGIILTRDPYDSVAIGNQVWMTKNLELDVFRNGDPIPQAKSAAQWKKAGENHQPAWCYYENNPKYGKKYGKLYNWYAVSDPRGLAPTGWHIPTEEECKKLLYNLGGVNVYRGDDFPIHISENGDKLRDMGFDAILCGYRFDSGEFTKTKYSNNYSVDVWWSSTNLDSDSKAAFFGLNYATEDIQYDWGWEQKKGTRFIVSGFSKKTYGFSVRCIKNN